MAASRKASVKKEKLPGPYQSFIARFPALSQAHEQVAKTVDECGPLNRRSCELVKIGICVGAGLESALKSHVRRAMKSGATKKEIEQAILLGMNTVGFPRTVAAWTWANMQFERGVD